MPYALMNGPKQLYIKFKVSNEDIVQERVMFETRIRYEVELGQESGPGLFRRLKLKQWQKRCENEVRQYRQLATDPRTKHIGCAALVRLETQAGADSGAGEL